MTAPVFLIEGLAPPPVGSVVAVTGEEGRHGAQVRRLRVDESVDLVDGMGMRAGAVVSAVGAAGFEVRVQQVLAQPPPDPRLVVVQALVKGSRSEAGVEMLTECGADEIVPWAAERCVAEWRRDRARSGADRWRAVARAATKQSRRAWLPAIGALATTADVSERLRHASLGLVLHEAGAARLARVTPPATGEIVLVVGPEGGITPAEMAAFERAGALAVRMGESILRTSTAGVAAAAVLLAAAGRWDQ